MTEQVKQKLQLPLASYQEAKSFLEAMVAEYLPKDAVVRVNSSSPSFHGIGIVVGQDKILLDHVNVRLENGNVWAYRLDSIEEVLSVRQYPGWVTARFKWKYVGPGEHPLTRRGIVSD